MTPPPSGTWATPSQAMASAGRRVSSAPPTRTEPRSRADQPAHGAQQRGLARPVGAEHGGDRRRRRVERHVVEGAHRAVRGRHALHVEREPASRHRRPPPVRWRRWPPRRGRRTVTSGSACTSAGVPDAMTWPSSRTTTRSHTLITRSMWCSTSATPMRPRSAGCGAPRSVHLGRRQPAGRLVEQQQAGLRHQGTGEGDLLLDGVGQRGRESERRTPRCPARPARRGPGRRARPRRPGSGAGRTGRTRTRRGPGWRRRPSRSRARSGRARDPAPAACARSRGRRGGRGGGRCSVTPS